MMETVFTIGYAGFSPDAFVQTLHARQITVLIDVRSEPHSQYHLEYNKELIAKRLKKEHILYAHFAKEFGARQDNPAYYPNGYLDFELFAASEAFQNGVRRVVRGMEQGYRFTLMCAEKDPAQCHRAILAARAFHEAGYPVVHLLPNGETQTHEELENRLLNRYFPDRDQMTLFGGCQTREEYLKDAYRRRNAEIGYAPEDEDHEDLHHWIHAKDRETVFRDHPGEPRSASA